MKCLQLTRLLFGGIFCFMPFNTVFAVTQQTKLWTQLNLSGPLANVSKLEYMFQAQGRYNFDPNKFQQGFILGGVGYQYSDAITLWAGYQWGSHNNLNGNNSSNRLWQQLSWQIIQNDAVKFNSDSRMEELALEGQPSINYRFRQKITLELPAVIYNGFIPVVSDEVFINLTRPAWVTTLTVGQNRAFAGFDIPTSKKTFLEMGYLNQYLFRATNNQMNNIIYLSFNINT